MNNKLKNQIKNYKINLINLCINCYNITFFNSICKFNKSVTIIFNLILKYFKNILEYSYFIKEIILTL